jgi:hypothetical protein
MKKFKIIKTVILLLIISFAVFMAMISCNNTPEKKIAQSFYKQRFIKDKDFKVEKVEIYDTICINQIIDALPIFEKRIDIFQKNLIKMNSYRDSILKFNYPKLEKDSLLRIGRDRQEYYDRELEHLIHREMIYLNMNEQLDDSICGYYVKIITPKGTFDFIVSPLTYRIICPAFAIQE